MSIKKFKKLKNFENFTICPENANKYIFFKTAWFYTVHILFSITTTTILSKTGIVVKYIGFSLIFIF